MSPEAQGTPLANVLSDTPIGRLGDFGVNKNYESDEPLPCMS